MGMSPREIDRLSMWEYLACLDGWNAAQGGDKGGAVVTVAELDDEELRLMGVEGF